MKRISTYMISDNMQYHLRNREASLNDIQNKMGTQTRIKNLRDDPLAAARAIRYKSKIFRLERYAQNIDMVKSEMTQEEINLKNAVDILQKINELAIRGANGTLTREDISYIADEIDQLLQELIMIANAKREDGRSLFAGFLSYGDAFRVSMGPVDGSKVPHVTAVEYMGNIGAREVEISESDTVLASIPGNRAFWAENQQIYSTINATDYRVLEDSVIRIDGVDIQLRAGDNIHAIIAKINDAAVPVKASLDPVQNSLVLSSTVPHQIWPMDIEGRVLQDLGITAGGEPTPYLNLAETARVFGGSVFDMVMHLRDSLYKGDQLDAGGYGLRGIQDAIAGLLSTVAEIGAKVNRLDMAYERIDYERVELTGMESREIDLDLAEAAVELSMLENAHRAALAVSARIMQPSLLDFIR